MRAVAEDFSSLPLALKGGTALLFCYGLDRFSEDLDFDGSKKLNLESRLRASLARVTKHHDIRIAKDTDTVQRYKILYHTVEGAGNLKVETSYRTGFQASDVILIDGI
jgi:predicted nucleotidyltransferase component of viral defense system